MSKTVTFSVSTGYVGSEKEEVFTLEELGIDESMPQEEIEEELREAFENWLWEAIDTNYYINED